jgi:hypothetical protein
MASQESESYIAEVSDRAIPYPPCSFYLLWSLKAQELGLLSKLSKGCDSFTASLYADDDALFLKPTPNEIKVTNTILEVFARASGLFTNMTKTQFFPISYEGMDLCFLAQDGRTISSFPCQYLGLPLHFGKLPRAMVYKLIQKIGDRLPGWKRDFSSYPGKELLINYVLSSLPTYFLTVFPLPKWGFSKIDRFQRGFLWKGKDHNNVRGDHCLVNWSTCMRPKYLGRLGIKDLEKFSRALRLRWLWHGWDHLDRPWKHLIKITNQTDMQLFFTSTAIAVGDGRNTPFRESRWINGTSPKEIAPRLFKLARFKGRNVHTELTNNRWISNIQGISSPAELEEYTMLYMVVSGFQLSEQKDHII